MAGRTLPAPRVVAPKLIDAVDDDVLAAQFLLFLKGYVEPGEEFGFYRAQVHSMRKQGRYKLKVDFDHLLRCLRDDRNYIKLVFRIGNDTDSKHQWLRLVVRQFLKDEEFGGEEEKINNNAEVSFVNRPISIRMLKDFLEDQVPLIKDITVLAGRFTVRATTARGRQAFRSVLAELLLLKHKHDEFYDGDFGIEDLVIINSTRCLILKKPQSLPSMSTLGGHTSTAKAKVNDLKKLWTIMEKYYIRGGVFPLYFVELSADLTSASEADIREAWFADYLLSHPALMPSMSRKHLVCELHSAVRVFKLGRDPEFKAILSARPIYYDWRLTVRESGDDILLGVYWYKFDDVNETNEEPHENTTEGILRYKRHLLQHTIDHIDKAKNAKAKDRGKGKKEGKDKEKDDDLNDLDEIELFAAATVPSFFTKSVETPAAAMPNAGKAYGCMVKLLFNNVRYERSPL